MRELADILAKIGAIHVSFDKPYDHGKGKTFPFYCDTRLLLAHPEARTKVVKALIKLMEDRRPDAIIAVATGGLPTELGWPVSWPSPLAMSAARPKATA